jgi:hypothetical protein
MRLSASIMAHPDRGRGVTELMTRLDRPVAIAWDDQGPASGNADRVWRTARAGWLLHDPEADWHLLLQDDASPSDDLLAGLELALETVPQEAVVSLYLGNGRHVPSRWGELARRADERHASWVRTLKLMWGVGIVLPTAAITSMIEHADRRGGVPDDMRVAGWAERQGREVWYTWPSLVDHLPVDSLTKHRATERRARRHHIGSTLELNWNGSVVTDPMLERRRGSRSGPSRLRAVRSGFSAPDTGRVGKRA